MYYYPLTLNGEIIYGFICNESREYNSRIVSLYEKGIVSECSHFGLKFTFNEEISPDLKGIIQVCVEFSIVSKILPRLGTIFGLTQ